jgi:hypothetical protein
MSLTLFPVDSDQLNLKRYFRNCQTRPALLILPSALTHPSQCVTDIVPGDTWWGQMMDDASGKFALADQVRVHHKRTKHEYVFRVAGRHLDVDQCIPILRR